MVTFTEVLHAIATDILSDKSGIQYDFNMSITNDLKQSEDEFIARYGQGKSYHFPIESYEHGKQLAVAIYQNLSGKKAEAPENTASDKNLEKGLFLFIHLSPVKTA